MFDLVLIDIPYTNYNGPLAASAYLKASVVQSGFTCKTLDLNIRFVNALKKDSDLQPIADYFVQKFDLSPKLMLIKNTLINEWADEILKLNPRFVGLSVFTYNCRTAAEDLSRALKQKNPDIKIILGGQGISQGGINGINAFPIKLQSEKIIDFFVKSEAEISLVELMKGNTTYIGVNSDNFLQIKNTNDLPPPNFDDYIFDEYSNFRLTIVGSKGCVRKCSFCDIHQHWKYSYSQGETIFNQIKYLHTKYKINKFNFADSLINGNIKQLKIFLKLLAEYNQNLQNKITWSAQYIVRPASIENEDHWKLMKDSGCDMLYIGVESGSEQVRIHMNKAFKNEDLDFVVSQLDLNSIPAILLIIVGYPTETEEDFQQTLHLVEKYKHLAKKGLTFGVSELLGILPGTPLYNNAKNLGLILDDKYEFNWIAESNQKLNLKERIRRKREMSKLLIDFGYTHVPQHDLLRIVDENIEKFDKRMQLKKVIQIKKEK